MQDRTPLSDREPEMALTPGGEFLMGSDPQREGKAEAWEGPQHTLYLPDFWMTRTPVTNGQYAAFLQDTDHPRPKRWRSRKSPRGKEDLPIVYVSWHDALAYCRWLAEVTGRPYRLPSEAEWEKGASWEAAEGRKRRYPWGARWNRRHCNTGEGGAGKITPVDAYPQGASPYGLLDMAGNAWEWTTSLWGANWYEPAFGYPYDASDGREDLEAEDRVARVLRGGSFAYTGDFARCTYRYKSFPQSYSDGIGFRLAHNA